MGVNSTQEIIQEVYVCIVVNSSEKRKKPDPGKFYYYLCSSCLRRNAFYVGNSSDLRMAEQVTRSLDQEVIKIMAH